MSTHSTISRYLIILKRLKAKPYCSFEELEHALEREFEFLQSKDDSVELAFSKRTFQREIKAIRKLFDINIEFSKKEKGYYIVPNEMENTNFLRMMEAFNMFQSLNMAQDLEPFIHLEKRRPQGTENLYGLLHAIKNKLQVTFTYHKYWDDEIKVRTVEPYSLKEFEQRWYLLCMDMDKKAIRTFALDRISELDISRTTFRFPKQFNIESYFNNFFGITTIISGDEEAPQEIILSFTENQGKYIKSLPLHHSQQIVIDTEAGLQIKLQVCITHDLIMKLLSFGSDVKVLQPQSLVEEMKERLSDAWKQYESF